ncbi:MAG TPA: urease accessory protein UreD [Methylomirabilota bacterium]|nr:urease accessory protein UreD [Methylomirabilota bacterium]
MLRERRFTLPLQALEPMDLEGDGVATLLLLNPTGGILAGDRLDTDISLGPGSRVCLSTPSATRVYRSPGPSAVQRISIGIGRGAALEWMPDHLIPSPGARLRQATEITLAPGATLLHLDAWATGRLARGETWGFDLLDTSLLVRDAVGPLLHERCILSGGAGWDGLGGTEGFGYVATFAAIRAGRHDAPSWDDLARALQEDLVSAGPECRAGVTRLGRGGVLARLLCPGAPTLRACVEALWTRCRRELMGLGPLRLRKL